MDPRLRLLVESGDESDEVAVLVRLESSDLNEQSLPPDVRVVARLGDVATVRVPRASVARLHESDGAASVKAPWTVVPEPVVVAPASRPWLPKEVQRERELRALDDLPLTGAGVIVGVVDWGLDVTHPAFRNPDGSTRVLALWDQQPGPDPDRPNRYGYGRVHDRAALDRALRSVDPAAALGYFAQLSDLGAGAHGTATTSIAAGGDWPGGVPGVARDADIVFVQLSTWGPEGPQRLGDCVALAEAFAFIRDTAAGRPFVISCSLGGCCGPHDGTSLLERAMDNLVLEGPGMIGQSCGNYFTSGKHTAGRLGPGGEARLPVEVPAASPAPHELDLWYAGPDRFAVSATGPGGSPRAFARPGCTAVVEVDGAVVGHLVHRLNDPNDGCNQVLLRLKPSAPWGIWHLVVEAIDARDGRFHAWIERDPVGRASQAHFSPDVSVTSTTTGTICNGLHTLVVGAYDHHDPQGTLAPFSSRGPTVDGRLKPDVVAPGRGTLVARSRPPGSAPGDDVPLHTVMSGTSMAAPHVAGVLACLLQTGRLPAALVRAAVLHTCRPYVGDDPERAGSGYLDPAAAMAYLLDRLKTSPSNEMIGGAGEALTAEEAEVTQLPDNPDSQRPTTAREPGEILADLDTTARELVAAFVTGTDVRGRNRLDAKVTLLSGPGDLVDPELRAGDLLVRGAVSEGLARAMTFVDGRLLERDRATRVGWDLESTLPGQYAVVIEDGRLPRAAIDQFARRITDEHSLIPAGQAVLRPAHLADERSEGLAEDSGPAGPSLRSTKFAGDDELTAVAAGRVRLAARRTAPYPAPVTSSGEGVRKIQEALTTLGYPVGSAGADGRFGDDTGRAVSRYKSERGISPSDPVVGPTTIRRLDEDLVAREGPRPVPHLDPLPSPDQRTSRWVAALGSRMRPGNQVTGLVDGRETFGAFLAAIRTATGPGHFIYLLGWWLDLDVPLDPATQPAYCANLPLPAVSATTMRTLLRVADSSGVQVRVMLWDQTGSSQNTAEVRYVNGLPHGAAILDNNQIRNWVGSQHQKVVIVGGSEGLVAFCGGLDINLDRICPTFPPGSAPLLPGMPTGSASQAGRGTESWESANVARLASGVLPESSSGSSGGGGGDPLHDVHVRITGPAADDLLQVFVQRWYANPEHLLLDRAKGALRGLCQPPSPLRGQAFVRIDETFSATYAAPRQPVRDCSAPPPLGPVTRVRERDIQQTYLTAIAQARQYIYWEDQYMVNMCAAEALRRALAQVNFVILLMADSSISDLPHRWAWRKRFVEHLRRDPQGSKLHVFTLRDTATGSTGPHTYVHAKTLMVDDELSIIGSANCNRRGWESDTEVTASIAGDVDLSGRPFASRIRQRLWAEHLGVRLSVVEDPVASAPLWWLPASVPGRTVVLPSGAIVNVSGRRVLPYDVNAGTDSTLDSHIPDDVADPPAPLPGSPCGGTPITSTATDPAQRRLAGTPVQSIRLAVG